MKEDPDKWLYDQISAGFMQSYAVEDTLYSGKTSFQAVEVIANPSFGRCLFLDGKIQSSELDEFIYHEALVHPPMLSHPCPQRVFIAGGGEGATLREVLVHRSVERVAMADLDKAVVGICRQFLPSWNQGSFDDPRAEILHLDAREYLAASEERFDVIIIDITEPLEGSPSYLLYTQQFYHLVQERLTPQGILSVQAGSCSWGDYSLFVAINNTLRGVFPRVFPYQTHIPSFGSLWGFALASSQLDPLSLSAEEIDRRISARVTRSLRFYDGTTHQGMFSMPKNLREEIKKGSRIITDDNPMFLY